MNFFTKAIQEISGIEQKTILSLGCGVMQELRGMRCFHITGVDAYKPYLDKLEAEGFKGRLICEDITKLICYSNSFDIVMAYDVLEHLDERKVIPLLEKMKGWARHSVWIYTPAIFDTNEFVDPVNKTGNLLEFLDKEEPNWKGTGINPLQLHKCLIKKDMLQSMGYTVMTPYEDRVLWAFYKKQAG